MQAVQTILLLSSLQFLAVNSILNKPGPLLLSVTMTLSVLFQNQFEDAFLIYQYAEGRLISDKVYLKISLDGQGIMR